MDFLKIVLLHPSTFLKVLFHSYDKSKQLIILNTLCNSSLFQSTLELFLKISGDRDLKMKVVSKLIIGYKNNCSSKKNMPTLVAMIGKMSSTNKKNPDLRKKFILDALESKRFKLCFLMNLQFNGTYTLKDIFNIRNILANHRKQILSGDVCNSLNTTLKTTLVTCHLWKINTE